MNSIRNIGIGIVIACIILLTMPQAAYAAFPCREGAVATAPSRVRSAVPDRRYHYHAYSAQQKSGVFGILSFCCAIVSFLCVVIAALVLLAALPTSLATVALFTIPGATYFYLAMSMVFSGAAFIMGLVGIKRPHSGLAIAGFVLGTLLLIAGVSILSNI